MVRVLHCITFFLSEKRRLKWKARGQNNPVADHQQGTGQQGPEISKQQPELTAIVSAASALPKHSAVTLPDVPNPQLHILALWHLTHHAIIDQNTASAPVNAHRAADLRGADAELRGDARCELSRVAGQEVDRVVGARGAGGGRATVVVVVAEDVEAGGWAG
jgi:hypothetical protein